METKSMTTKQRLAYTLETARAFKEYLAARVNYTEQDAADSAREGFTDYDPNEATKRNTIDKLVRSIRYELKAIADSYLNLDPDIIDCKAESFAQKNALQELSDTYSADSRAKMNTLLDKHGLNLILSNWERDELILCSKGDEYLNVHFYRYTGYAPIRAEIRNVTGIRLENTDKTHNAATFLASAGTLLGTHSLLEDILDIWTTWAFDRENTIQQMKDLNEQATDTLCALVYKRLKTFAKDILDIELPETLK